MSAVQDTRRVTIIATIAVDLEIPADSDAYDAIDDLDYTFTKYWGGPEVDSEALSWEVLERDG